MGTRDIDRANEPRLSPRKADLFRWRQGFADKLRELGVDAAASERRHRFNYRKSEHPVVRQIRAENPNSAVFDKKRAEGKAAAQAAQARSTRRNTFVEQLPRTPRVYEGLKTELQHAIKTGIRPQNPAYEKNEASRKATLAAWSEVAKNLEKAGDFALAMQVREIMQDGLKQPISRNQELYDVAVKNRAKEMDRSHQDGLSL